MIGVEAVRNTVEVPSQYLKFAREFVEAIVSHGPIPPETVDEIYIAMDRPAQRGRADMVLPWLYFDSSTFKVRAFTKRECYAKIGKGPRNISTVPTDHTIRGASYNYAVKACVLTEFEWYTPGCTPIEIAERVMNLAARCESITVADATSMDGHLSAFIRKNVIGAIYLGLFRLDPELRELLDVEFNAHAVTAHGIRYCTYTSLLSGSPWTTDFNTLTSMFMIYCAMRQLQYAPAVAIAAKAMVYGDDVICDGVLSSSLTKVATDLGYKLKTEVRSKGSYVTFLSRVYVCPWTTRTSFQDPRRCLPKLNSTVSVLAQNSIRMAAVNKASGYLVTDRYTPLVSNFCRLVLRHYRSTEDYMPNLALRDDLPWFFDPDCPWPQSPCDVEVMEEVMSDLLDLPVDELRSVCETLDRASRLWLKDPARPTYPIIHRNVEVLPDVAIVEEAPVEPTPIEPLAEKPKKDVVRKQGSITARMARRSRK